MKNLMLMLFLVYLSACSDRAADIRHDFSSAVSKNAQAASHIEWETSELQPKIIFSKYREQYYGFLIQEDMAQADKFTTDICKALDGLTDQSLVLFETELRRVDNDEVISFCKFDLLGRLEAFHKLGRKELKYSVNAFSSQPSNIDFKLKMDVDEILDVNSFNKFWANLKDHEVILTFDDGPDPVYTESILKTLKEAGDIKAHFFTLGKNVQDYPLEAKKEFQAGHVVANHSWNHYCLDESEVCRKYNTNNFNHLPVLTDSDVLAEIEKTFEVIQKAVGTVAPLFRFPFGNERASMSKYLKERNAFVVKWSIDSNDWRQMQSLVGQEIPYTNADMIKNVISAIEVKKKGLILFHDVHRRTAESLPQVLYELYKRDYKVILLKTKPIDAIKLDRDVILSTPYPSLEPPPIY